MAKLWLVYVMEDKAWAGSEVVEVVVTNHGTEEFLVVPQSLLSYPLMKRSHENIYRRIPCDSSLYL